MESNIDSTNDIKHGRPKLLSVTCILTWIACALLLISSLSGLMTQSPEKQQQQIDQMRKISPEAAEKMEAALANDNGAKKILTTLLNILAIALCAFGAVQMWNLKQTGFYFYLIGEVLPYIGLLIAGTEAMAAASALAGSLGSAVIGVVITLLIVFDVVFIVLYAVNLKYMVPPSQFD
ncbi:MAG: hypothetical protein Q8L81_13570 [Bacteroidota bacterium]|nr:hypothetical protein [Bacteroidota bacterium]